MQEGKILIGLILLSLFALLILSPVNETNKSYFPYSPGVPDGGIIKGTTVRLSWQVQSSPQKSIGIYFKESFSISPEGLFKIEVSGRIPVDCLEYEVYFGENPEPAYYRTLKCDQEIIIENLKKNKIYYWQIVVNNEEKRYLGPIWYFYTY